MPAPIRTLPATPAWLESAHSREPRDGSRIVRVALPAKLPRHHSNRVSGYRGLAPPALATGY